MIGPGIAKKYAATDNITTAETSALVVDTLGYDYCVLDVKLGTVANTAAVTAGAITESDDATTYTTVAALSGGTATSSTVGWVWPAHTGTTTTASEVYASFNIDLRPRKRYLKAAFTPTAACEIGIVASLYKADEMPTSASEANAQVLVIA